MSGRVRYVSSAPPAVGPRGETVPDWRANAYARRIFRDLDAGSAPPVRWARQLPAATWRPAEMALEGAPTEPCDGWTLGEDIYLSVTGSRSLSEIVAHECAHVLARRGVIHTSSREHEEAIAEAFGRHVGRELERAWEGPRVGRGAIQYEPFVSRPYRRSVPAGGRRVAVDVVDAATLIAVTGGVPPIVRMRTRHMLMA